MGRAHTNVQHKYSMQQSISSTKAACTDANRPNTACLNSGGSAVEAAAPRKAASAQLLAANVDELLPPRQCSATPAEADLATPAAAACGPQPLGARKLQQHCGCMWQGQARSAKHRGGGASGSGMAAVTAGSSPGSAAAAATAELLRLKARIASIASAALWQLRVWHHERARGGLAAARAGSSDVCVGLP
jgi:hypothetical protein